MLGWMRSIRKEGLILVTLAAIDSSSNQSTITSQTTLTITRGLPSSGKTTWARVRSQRNDAVILNSQEVIERASLSPTHRNFHETVELVFSDLVVGLLESGTSVIIDEDNLDIADVERWCQLAHSVTRPIRFEIVDFDIPVEEAIRRDASRLPTDTKKNGARYIQQLADKYLVDGKLPDVSKVLEACDGTVEIVYNN